jgi:putative redox protein
MSHIIKTEWKGKMAFNSLLTGGEVALDADNEVGGEGNGVRPKPLMLAALSGCTGMDVTSLMKKMRTDESVSKFTIEVEGNLTEEHPKIYDKVHVVYTFEGTGMIQAKLEKAVTLSVERYCGVFEMFRQFAIVTHEIIFIEK